jgi:hypothetical protein
MFWIIAIVLALLWAAGLATSYTLGGFIHVLILLAVALVVARLMRGQDRRDLIRRVGE